MDFFRANLRDLLERWSQSGFTKEAANERAHKLIGDCMAMDSLVQNNQLLRADALESAKALLQCAMQMEPPTTGGADSSREQSAPAPAPALAQAGFSWLVVNS